MLGCDDERCNLLTGGYRTPFDPRPLLRKLENGEENAAAWHELWGELVIANAFESGSAARPYRRASRVAHQLTTKLLDLFFPRL